MTALTQSERQDLTLKLASARQSLAILQGQAQSNRIDPGYVQARLREIAAIFEAIEAERSNTDQQQRLAALYEVSRMMGSSLNLEEVLNQVMDSIIRLTGAERGFLMLFNEMGGLEVRAARNVDQETLSKSEFAYSRSVIKAVAESGEQVVTTNASEDPRFQNQASVIANKLRSIQCVPLRARGEMIGVIYVDNSIATGVFSEADLEMLAAFASQAAIAIENARLFTLTDKALANRVQELSLMQEIDRQLNQDLDIAKVLGLTLEWAVRMARADNGAIGLIDVDEGRARVVARHGQAPSGVTGILSGQQPADRPGSLAVPIQREGRVIGVITLDRSDETPFDMDTFQFVQRLADHAAVAIQNSQLYDEVQKANQAKSEFISVVTHELRLPMTSIRGYADMLRMSDNLNEQQHKFLSIIRSNVDRMSVQVSDLSDIARIEAGRLRLEPDEEFNLKDGILRVIAGIQAEIDRRGHHLTLDIPANLPTVRADPDRAEQILINLISNAYKYTPDGGTVTVRTRQIGSMVQCDVTDSGVGMSADDLKMLFTKFWRADNRHVRDQPGTGLGLTIVKNLVELQGGELSVDSVEGQGTTFSFTLPISHS